jgi:hypothetical protein
VCFAVACKIIACNIKRWAKALVSLKKAVQGFMPSLWAWVKAIVARLTGISLVKRHRGLVNVSINVTASTPYLLLGRF